MVPPNLFLRIICAIRRRFDTTLDLRLTVDSLREQVGSNDACAAAVAVLVNGKFLKWTDDHCLVRCDVDMAPPRRRTA